MSHESTNSSPYASLANVYDRWMALENTPYERWCDFIDAGFRVASINIKKIIDVCCGTGIMTKMMQERGYEVTGIDASPAMLAVARERTAPGTLLIEATLPSSQLNTLELFDGAMCCFDSANYFAEDGQFSAILRQIGQALRPGGILVFDLNTRYKLETVFGMSHFSDDFEDFAYIWRNRYDADSKRCEFLISLFTQEGTLYQRTYEHHTQRWFSQDEVEAALAGAGFRLLSVRDSYSDKIPEQTTSRETWIAEQLGFKDVPSTVAVSGD